MDDFDELLDGLNIDNDKSKATGNDAELKQELEQAAEKIKVLEDQNKDLVNQLEAAFSAQQGEAGKPILAPIEDVIEDPDRPNARQDVDEEFEKWLTQNIMEQQSALTKEQIENEAASGIQDPISVRWCNERKKWIINKGHTRRKCGERAKLTHVPILIQPNSTDWNQVIENLIRKGLSTKDMVAFIKRKKDEGIKQKEIAKRLSRDAGWVSKHVALIDPPTFVKTIWDNKYATDFTVLYGLVTVYKMDQSYVEEEVNKVIADKKFISEDDVNSIKKALAKGKNEDETEEEIDSNEEGEEASSSEDQGEQKVKTTLKLQLDFEGQVTYLVMQEPSEEGNLVMELETGAIMEAPVGDVSIVGMTEVEM